MAGRASTNSPAPAPGASGSGSARVVIENVQPEVDGGRYPAKITLGERPQVEADIFVDGQDSILAKLLYRHESGDEWAEVALESHGNDRWTGTFPVTRLGAYLFTIVAWTSLFHTWARQLRQRIEARQDVSVDLLIGARIVESIAERAEGSDSVELAEAAAKLADETLPPDSRAELAVDEELLRLIEQWPDRSGSTRYEKELGVTVDPPLARFSSWYEMFPRSASDEPGVHGTFKDCEKRLPYVAEMGFDVLYLPPIHPIGTTNRKGKNNSQNADLGDVGSPWAIGSAEGGHKAINPALGTLADFRRLVDQARRLGVEVALDMAFQCSPDHPYIAEHPEWFRTRPDGTIQFAENPPKRYEDIVPFDFDGDGREALIEELTDVVRHWVAQGVKVFRVDNPHTKPFALWERLISTLKQEEPELIFLSEAFTRPAVMHRLAKVGFTQSYTYFAWRNNKSELTKYLADITGPPTSYFFRPSLWPNTPDILTEYLQTGERPAFVVRLVLAATLGSSYGIYGPAFELLESAPREPGSEEYLDSEKYQLRHWNLDRPDSLRHLISLVNRIRRENTPLQYNSGLAFHETDNPYVICYSKRDPGHESTILTTVNLDPHHTQSAWIDTAALESGRRGDRPYQMHDLLSGARYLWQGERNYVELNPRVSPAHIFAVRRFVRTERDFDYFL